jgi:hypothetical protein
VPKIYKNKLYKSEDRHFPENERLPRNILEEKIKIKLFKTIPSGNLSIQFFFGCHYVN